MTQSKHFFVIRMKLTIVVLNKVLLHHSTYLVRDLPRPRATLYAALHLVARGQENTVLTLPVAYEKLTIVVGD